METSEICTTDEKYESDETKLKELECNQCVPHEHVLTSDQLECKIREVSDKDSCGNDIITDEVFSDAEYDETGVPSSSAENNTFNIINTETSDTPDASEITYEEDELPNNGTENGTNDNEGISIIKEISLNNEVIKEGDSESDESDSYDVDSESLEEMLPVEGDNKEFDDDSLEDEEITNRSSSVKSDEEQEVIDDAEAGKDKNVHAHTEAFAQTQPKNDTSTETSKDIKEEKGKNEEIVKNTETISGGTTKEKSTASKIIPQESRQVLQTKKKVTKPKIRKPKFRSNLHSENEFTIEIFESKKKLDLSTNFTVEGSPANSVSFSDPVNKNVPTIKEISTNERGNQGLDCAAVETALGLNIKTESINTTSISSECSVTSCSEENVDFDSIPSFKDERNIVLPEKDSLQKDASSRPEASPPTPRSADPRESSSSPPDKSDGSESSLTTTPQDSNGDLPPEGKKPQPMAFTIDLGADLKKLPPGGGGLSRWTPKHRRNLSLTKVEENKKVEEKLGKPPLGRPRSGTVGSAPGRKGPGGYHSEGYFSSDQDDEGPKRSDLKSPRTPELRSPIPHQNGGMVVMSDPEQSRNVNMRRQQMKPEGRSCCKGEKKLSVAELTGKVARDDKVMKASAHLKEPIEVDQNVATCNFNEDVVQDQDREDTVSEAGTYTIEKDSPSTDAEQARTNIDMIFGVQIAEPEIDVSSQIGPKANAWSSLSESESFKQAPALSRNAPNWIQQWAAQVAVHTSKSVSAESPRGQKGSPTCSTSQETIESRPRRKLPTPPTHLGLNYTSANSPRASDYSDHESPSKNKARVDLRKGMPQGLRGSSFESHDSGGDSDLDTSTSYPINEDDCLSSSLRNKLKLNGLESYGKSPSASAVSSPRNISNHMESRLKMNSSYAKERGVHVENLYMYKSMQEEQNLQSDSSSETSEINKDARKVDNNPPLKYNRAFSLRRARLNCGGSTTSPKQVRSAAPEQTVKKTPLGVTKSNQSTDTSNRAPPSASSKGGPDSFSRNDGGRFSLRLARSGSTNAVSKSPLRTAVKKTTLTVGPKKVSPRSNSTLTSKEIDFQNWKRRKNYDPMKAAAAGKKKLVEKRAHQVPNATATSIPEDSLGSASFHGTEGVPVENGTRWPKHGVHQNQYTSEDDGPYSYEEETLPHVPHVSPLRRSPTSPHQLVSSPMHVASPDHLNSAGFRGRRSSYTNAEDTEVNVSSPSRKISLEESGSEGKRSPLAVSVGSRGQSVMSSGAGRPKAKMEALDNLVISTIHSLSCKVRTTSETLLQKLKSQYNIDGDRSALLEEVLAHLSETDQCLSGSQARSTSKELAGILRNLKKIEHALGVIDKIICGDDEEDDEMDEEGEIHSRIKWCENDY